MKKYLTQIAFFLIPLLVFFCLLEWQIRQVPNDFIYKSEYLKNHASKIEVLVLGSSHSLSFIEPELMKPLGFNAANLHQTLKFDALIFHRFIDQMPRLNTVIIPISYGSFFTSLTEGKDRWRMKDYKRHYGFDEVNAYYDFEVLNGSTPHQIKEVWSYLSTGKNNITCSEKGFGLLFSQTAQANLNKTGALVARRHTLECSDQFIDENRGALVSIIEKCKARGIKVFLYTAPAYTTYREKIDWKLMNKTYEIIHEIFQSHPEIIYKNYFDDPRFVASDFRDVDHLNKTGADKFTQIIMTDAGIESLESNEKQGSLF